MSRARARRDPCHRYEPLAQLVPGGTRPRRTWPGMATHGGAARGGSYVGAGRHSDHGIPQHAARAVCAGTTPLEGAISERCIVRIAQAFDAPLTVCVR